MMRSFLQMLARNLVVIGGLFAVGVVVGLLVVMFMAWLHEQFGPIEGFVIFLGIFVVLLVLGVTYVQWYAQKNGPRGW